MTAINEAVVWSVRYSLFGKATVEVETVENNLRFPGQYSDQETGLHYNYHRYYDPMTGRYLRVDPVGSLIGRVFINEINHLYVYGNNNPIKSTDPLGLQYKCYRWEYDWSDYWECIKEAYDIRSLILLSPDCIKCIAGIIAIISGTPPPSTGEACAKCGWDLAALLFCLGEACEVVEYESECPCIAELYYVYPYPDLNLGYLGNR